MQVAVVMQVLVTRFRFLHAQKLRTLNDTKRKSGLDDVPPELVPLMKGAWIGKPSANAQRKRR